LQYAAEQWPKPWLTAGRLAVLLLGGADDDDHERAGFGPRPGLTFRGGAKLRRGKIQRVGRRIDTHRARAPRSLYRLDDLERSW
jgi:hypothetical protein